jgi:hypothetical protein
MSRTDIPVCRSLVKGSGDPREHLENLRHAGMPVLLSLRSCFLMITMRLILGPRASSPAAPATK